MSRKRSKQKYIERELKELRSLDSYVKKFYPGQKVSDCKTKIRQLETALKKTK